MRCSCGQYKVETYLCPHERDAARALTIPILEFKFFDKKDKTSTWKKQYNAVKDSFVSTNDKRKKPAKQKAKAVASNTVAV